MRAPFFSPPPISSRFDSLFEIHARDAEHDLCGFAGESARERVAEETCRSEGTSSTRVESSLSIRGEGGAGAGAYACACACAVVEARRSEGASPALGLLIVPPCSELSRPSRARRARPAHGGARVPADHPVAGLRAAPRGARFARSLDSSCAGRGRRGGAPARGARAA